MQTMINILRDQPGVINEVNRLAQTPLHLAVPWPAGIEVLLNHNASLDPHDVKGYTPLRYAIELGFADSVLPLMKAGCSLQVSSASPRDGLTDALTLACYKYHFPMWSVSKTDAEQTLDTLIASLAKRRAHLQNQLAASVVANKIGALLYRSDRNLDEHTFRAEQVVKTYGLPSLHRSSLLPGGSNSHLPSVYHAGFLTAEIAGKLWQAGFRDIDVPNEQGRTPLMGQLSPPCYISMVDGLEIESKLASWFVEKGAKLHRPLNAHSEYKSSDASETMDLLPITKALHEVAFSIGSVVIEPLDRRQSYNVSRPQDKLKSLSENSNHFLARILSDPSPDSCKCACSSGGCLSFIILLKQFRKAEEHQAWNRGIPICRRCCSLRATNFLIDLLGAQNSRLDRVFNEVVRFCTFVELSLKHTCCRGARWCSCPLNDLDDIAELQDEDSEGIKLLESLMQEFKDNRNGQDIPTFMYAYWAPRMNEILENPGVVDKGKLREAGVIIYQDEVVAGDDNDESSPSRFCEVDDNGNDIAQPMPSEQEAGKSTKLLSRSYPTTKANRDYWRLVSEGTEERNNVPQITKCEWVSAYTRLDQSKSKLPPPPPSGSAMKDMVSNL